MGVRLFGGFQPSTSAHGFSQRVCLVRENFQVGAEFYGGLGTANNFTVHGTSQYVAPVVSWQVHEAVFKISPTVGLTDESYRFMLRFGATYEFASFGREVKKLFH